MEDIFNKEEHAKNLYVIRHKLGDLKSSPWGGHFEWQIGHYRVKIFGAKHGDPQPKYITQCETVDVHVYEVSKREDKHEEEKMIDLIEHPLFKNYKAIQYDVITTPNGTINRSDGRKIPIGQLCELIKYLHRLVKLAIFM
jgi:hypothetical protein